MREAIEAINDFIEVCKATAQSARADGDNEERAKEYEARVRGLMYAKCLMQSYEEGWIPVAKAKPQEGNYILVSFSNWTMVDIGRYEKGVFYPGDLDIPYKDYDVRVNAWRPLPQSYSGGSNAK